MGAKTQNWNELGTDIESSMSDELIIRNTFINSRNAPVADIFEGESNNNN